MAKKRILVIDDSTDITDPLKLYLERTGTFEVRVEREGSKGLQAAREFRPDLILLDVMMPDMDGGDVAAEIDEDQELKQTPIVFLTASVTRTEMTEVGSIGGRPILSKLMTLSEIIDYLKKRLGA
jgi:DNA-binding response OmpR family regulator